MKPLIILVVFVSTLTMIPPQFVYLHDVDPTIIINPRYATPNNFVGEVVTGYLAPRIIITRLAAISLANVQTRMKQLGYSLVVYDAYRPQKAVDHFMKWSEQPEDFKTKKYYYPFINKEDIIPQGYVAKKSGHSRGSTVDLSIIPLGGNLHDLIPREVTLANGQTITYLDDGTCYTCSHFDFFGQASHHDTQIVNDPDCLDKRSMLKKVMETYGFRSLHEEWWHYTLIAEPFPDTYFDFDIV